MALLPSHEIPINDLAGHVLELDAIAGPTLRTLGPSGAPVTLRAVQTILGAR